MARLKIKQVKSVAGRPQDQRATLRALGLRKINALVEKEDRPEIRGMVRKVAHLVQVEQID